MAKILKENLIDNIYDVIVVGGGHAGIEASLARENKLYDLIDDICLKAHQADK